MANSLDLLIHSLMVTKCTSQEQIRRVHSSIRDSMVGVMDLSQVLICHKNLVLFTILKFSYLESQLTTLVFFPSIPLQCKCMTLYVHNLDCNGIPTGSCTNWFHRDIQLQSPANKCSIWEMVRASKCIQHPSKGITHGKFENNHPVHFRLPQPTT